MLERVKKSERERERGRFKEIKRNERKFDNMYNLYYMKMEVESLPEYKCNNFIHVHYYFWDRSVENNKRSTQKKMEMQQKKIG